MTKQEFITQIAGYVKKYAPQYGIRCCSGVIAQAILESGWGESRLAARYHNYFGLKCGTKWAGASVNMATQEEYRPGSLTTIKDNFRVYGSMEEGVKGYFEFIQLERYQNLRGIKDPEAYLETIKADGYATSSSYVENNMALVNQYGLRQYDKEGTSMSRNVIQQVIDDAVSFAVGIANDNSHGYSQAVRSLYNITNPTSFDCSSLVCTAFYYAFLKNGISPTPKDKGCSYTGNMLNLLNCGFEVVARNQTAHSQMIKGDIELNVTHHTALAVDGNNIVHARSSEGTSDTKDNSGNEIRVQPWYLYSRGWTHRLRFTGKGLILPEPQPEKDYLCEGDQGEAVRTYQGKLISVGYSCGSSGADGDFGSATKAATQEFQGDYELTVDGNAGPATQAKLNAEVKKKGQTQKGFARFVGEAQKTCAVHKSAKKASPAVTGYPKLAPGNLVDVLGRYGYQDGWYKVCIADEHIGYVWADGVKPVDAESYKDNRIEQGFARFVGEAQKTCVVHLEPKKASDAITGWPKLIKGNLVDVLGQDGYQDNWYKVCVADQYLGYVWAGNVKKV